MMRLAGPALAGLVGLALIAGQPTQARAADEPDRYLRVSLAQEDTRSTAFRDRRCDPPEPWAAYFGCVEGDDGRPVGAYGDFGDSLGGELALGWRFAGAWRGEWVVAHQPGFDFSGNANFIDTGELEPVSGDVSHTRTGLRVNLDLARMGGRVPDMFDPYLGFGVHVNRNRTSTMRYDFPELESQPALTTVPGDTQFSLGWMAALGAGFNVGPDHVLDLAVTYTDHGRVATDRDDIQVVRSGNVLAEIPVERTQARMRGWGAQVGVRFMY